VAKALPGALRGLRAEARLFRPGDRTVVLRLSGAGGVQRKALLAGYAAKAVLRVPRVEAAYWLAPVEGDALLLLSGGNSAALRSELVELVGAKPLVGWLRSPDAPWPGEGLPVLARVRGADLASRRCARRPRGCVPGWARGAHSTWTSARPPRRG
jgi:hypothetical protein